MRRETGRRLITAAALVAAVLLAWVALRDGESSSAVGDVSLRPPSRATPVLPDWQSSDSTAPADAIVADLPESNPQSIAPVDASLRIELPVDLLVLAPARVRLTRTSDGWTDARFVYTGEGTTWRGLPQGAYRLTFLDGEFTAPDADFLLAPGDSRTIVLTPRRTLRGVVRGARSQNPATAMGLDVHARAEGQADSLLGATSGHRSDGRFEIAGLPGFEEDPPPQGVWVSARTPDTQGQSDVVPLPDQGPTEDIVVLLPEPAIVGDVRFTPPLAEGQELDLHVLLLDSPERLALIRDLGPVLKSVDDRNLSTLVPGAEWPRVDRQGHFEVWMTSTPADSAWLAVLSNGRRPEVIGPLRVPPSGEPLHLDVDLVPGGTLVATFRIPGPRTSDPVSPGGSLSPVRGDRAPRGALAQLQIEWGPAQAAQTDINSVRLECTIAGLADGTYELVGSMTGPTHGRAVRTLVDIVGGGTVEALLDGTVGGGTVRGHVAIPPALAGLDMPASLFDASAASATPHPVAYALIDANGNFELLGVPAGDFVVLAGTKANAENIALAALPIHCEGAGAAEFKLALTQPQIRVSGAKSETLDLVGMTGLPTLDALLSRRKLSVQVGEGRPGFIFGVPPGRYDLLRADGSCAASFLVAATDTQITIAIR